MRRFTLDGFCAAGPYSGIILQNLIAQVEFPKRQQKSNSKLRQKLYEYKQFNHNKWFIISKTYILRTRAIILHVYLLFYFINPYA